MEQIRGDYNWARGGMPPTHELQRLDDLASQGHTDDRGAADMLASAAMSMQLTPPALLAIWARITGQDETTGELYAFEQIGHGAADGNSSSVFVPEDGVKTDNHIAREVNRNAAVPIGAVVQMWPSEESSGERWRFSYQSVAFPGAGGGPGGPPPNPGGNPGVGVCLLPFVSNVCAIIVGGVMIGITTEYILYDLVNCRILSTWCIPNPKNCCPLGSSGSGPPLGSSGGGSPTTGTCDCPCCPGGSPSQWSFSVSAVGAWADLHGDFHLVYQGDGTGTDGNNCTWKAEGSNGAYWMLRCVGGFGPSWELSGHLGDGTATAAFVLDNGDELFHCCDDNKFEFSRVFGPTAWTGDSEITLAPVGDCGGCEGPGGGGGSNCECPACPDGVPDAWVLEVPAITQVGAGVVTADCHSLEGEWVLTNLTVITSGQGTICQWTSTPDINHTPNWGLDVDSDGGAFLVGNFGTGFGAGSISYHCDHFDCCGVNVFVSDSPFGSACGRGMPQTLTMSPQGPCNPCGGTSSGGGGTVAVPCCGAVQIPRHLHATFTNGSGCSCMAGTTFVMTYNETAQAWESPAIPTPAPCGFVNPNPAGGQTRYSLFCSGGVWTFTNVQTGTNDCGAFGTLVSASVTCHPFLATFPVVSVVNCCGGSTKVTITE